LRRGSSVPAAALDEISGALDLVAPQLAAGSKDQRMAERLAALAQGVSRGGGDAITLKRKKGLADTLTGLSARLK
jgi:hypothetical protein